MGTWDAPNPARGMRHSPEKDRERFLQTHALPRCLAARADQFHGVVLDDYLVSRLTGAHPRMCLRRGSRRPHSTQDFSAPKVRIAYQ
jgi:hypothetical protein